MTDAIQWVGFAAGVFLILITAASIMKSLVVPRGHTSRISVFVGRRLVRRAFQLVADRFDDYEDKDRILALSAPTALLTTLLTWLVLMVLGYSLIMWPFLESFPTAMREAGSSTLTLGFANTREPEVTIIDFAAATTGLLVIALQIAYLPTIYGSFNRREMLVTMLQSRAGSPAWGPEIIARATLVSGLREESPEFYADWERWAADVAETHSTYPVLIWFRSPHPLRSWIIGLLAVLDSAALQLALTPSKAPPQARLVLRMGFTSLRYIADVIRIPYDPDPFPEDPIQLTYEEFLGGVHRLEAAGFEAERTPEEAWPHFRGWRVNYESIAYAIADAVTAPPAPWSGERSHLPDIALVPQRPTDRRPDRPEHSSEPKAERFGWRS